MANGCEDPQKLVTQLREWVNSQAHIPKEHLVDRILHRFLHSCYYDMDKTKQTLELFFSVRSAVPELLTNRDPLSPSLQKCLKLVNLGQLSISGNRKLWVWQLNDPGLENFDYVQDVKVFFLSSDAWLLQDEDLEDADIVLMDVKDISLKFITKFNVSVARNLSKYQEDAMPIRLKQIHVVNAPPFIDKIYGLMKPFLKAEVTNMIHFHKPKSETLYEYLNKEDLPSDYGGTLPSMEENMKIVTQKLLDQREILIGDLWKSDKKSKKDQAIDVGTFRSLAID